MKGLINTLVLIGVSELGGGNYNFSRLREY